jgi:hypothetical protein
MKTAVKKHEKRIKNLDMCDSFDVNWNCYCIAIIDCGVAN